MDCSLENHVQKMLVVMCECVCEFLKCALDRGKEYMPEGDMGQMLDQ